MLPIGGVSNQMAQKDRIRLLKQIEKDTGTYCIAYVTSTRPGLEVPMAMDSIRMIYEHLRLMGKQKDHAHVSLFIHTNGGDGTVPWRLVTLIREHAHRFTIMVPYRAFSAGTLTALGADRIIMHPMGMLGPTDPTVTNPFNPPDVANPGQKLGISVEDVTAYIALVKDDVGIQHEDELVQAFSFLASQVHPLALGNVKRFSSQSRMMAKKLLSLHMDSIKDGHKIEEIVDKLTSKLFYHGHPINREEAIEEVGLTTIQQPSFALEELLWRLYVQYEQEINMEEPFHPASEFVAQFPTQTAGSTSIAPVATANMAFIESVKRTDLRSLEYQLSGTKDQNGATSVTTVIRRQGWSQV